MDRTAFVVIVLLLLAIVGVVAVNQYPSQFGLVAEGSSEPTVENGTPDDGLTDREKFSLTIMQYVGESRIVGDGLLEELTGAPVTLLRYYVDTREVYAEVPEYADRDAITDKLVRGDRYEWGEPNDDGDLQIGELIYGGDQQFLRFEATALNVEPDDSLVRKYGPYTYTISAEELASSIKDEHVYGGKPYFKFGDDTCHNFGALISKYGDPSINRLALSICGGARTDDERAQRLLTFVNQYITYDEDERRAIFSGGPHVLKRAPEVLISGRATCGSMAVLYASLLEQVDISYAYVYYLEDRHVGVYVRHADTGNGYRLMIDGEPYQYAESTAPYSFDIGQSPVRIVNPTRPDALIFRGSASVQFLETSERQSLK